MEIDSNITAANQRSRRINERCSTFRGPAGDSSLTSGLDMDSDLLGLKQELDHYVSKLPSHSTIKGLNEPPRHIRKPVDVKKEGARGDAWWGKLDVERQRQRCHFSKPFVKELK
jgi:hypothetical protein